MFDFVEEIPPTPQMWPCAHCGRVCGDAEGGFGSYNGFMLCYPQGSERPNCYHLVAMEHHHVPCDKEGCWVGDVITNPDLAAEIDHAMDHPESLIHRERPRRKDQDGGHPERDPM